MNYQAIYDSLMSRARDRIIVDYTERHHVIPKCLGGTDDNDNLVALTPEEHYLAHQLLVKLYPDHHGLAYAAVKMTAGRNSNKLYGWLRRKYSDGKKGRKNSPEHIAKVAAAHRGMKRSDNTRRKISEAKRGKSRSDDVKRAVAAANKARAAKLTPEQRSDRARQLAQLRWSKK